MKFIQTFIPCLLLLIWGCNTSKVISQPIHSYGKVTYAIDVDADDEKTKENFGTQAIVEFNDELLKFTKNKNNMGFEYQLIDLQKNITWNYLDNMGDKVRIPEDERMIPKMGTPVFHQEYKTINGFKCQKMTAPMPAGEMVAFITKEIAANYCPYLNIDGFALSYSLDLPFGKVTYHATQFEKINPTLSFDNNYTTYSSFDELMKKLDETTGDLLGQTMIDFNITDLNGVDFSTDNLKEKITVFNFWFTSCAPCITEIPDLNKLKEKYKHEIVQFVAITFDDTETVTPFLQKHPFSFTIFPDQQEFINQLKIQTFPTTLVTDKSGIIIHSESGGSFSIFEDLSAVIDSALKQ